MNTMQLPYQLASEIDLNGKLNLAPNDYMNLIDALQAVGGERRIRETAAYFQTLPRDALILKIENIARLSKLLNGLRLAGRRDNHDLQSARPIQRIR